MNRYTVGFVDVVGGDYLTRLQVESQPVPVWYPDEAPRGSETKL